MIEIVKQSLSFDNITTFMSELLSKRHLAISTTAALFTYYLSASYFISLINHYSNLTY